MANYGMLRNYRFTDAAEDIRGSKLYGLDDDGESNEKLGKIDDVIFDHNTGLINYVVIDTGGWLSTKKFIVPAESLRPSTEHQDDFAVQLTKAQIESFPPYSENDLESDEQWSDYQGRYRPESKADPVMHRAATDRDITSTTLLMQGDLESARAADAPAFSSSAALHEGQRAPDIEDTAFEPQPGFAAGTDTVHIESGAVGIGSRWDTFQDRLRERRKEVITTGCTKETARDNDSFQKAS